jgi:hypothetical protein
MAIREFRDRYGQLLREDPQALNQRAKERAVALAASFLDESQLRQFSELASETAEDPRASGEALLGFARLTKLLLGMMHETSGHSLQVILEAAAMTMDRDFPPDWNGGEGGDEAPV